MPRSKKRSKSSKPKTRGLIHDAYVAIGKGKKLTKKQKNALARHKKGGRSGR